MPRLSVTACRSAPCLAILTTAARSTPERIRSSSLRLLASIPATLHPLLHDGRLPLRELLRRVLARLAGRGRGVDRISFVHYEPAGDRLATILCEEIGPEPRLSQPLAADPATAGDVRLAPSPLDTRPLTEHPLLVRLREPLVQNDLRQPAATGDLRGPWLLRTGWCSSLTLPLIREGSLLGFLFVDGRSAGAFDADSLRDLQPHLELLLLRIGDHLRGTATLQATLGLVLEIAGLRHRETASHLERVSLYSRLIALRLERFRPLPAGFSQDLYRFAAFHDVGKIGIPDAVLLKEGPLTEAEARLMRTHVTIGSALVERVIAALQLQSDPGMVVLRQVVAHHHELLDGSGYPLGLRGEAVSLAGRIVAVADIFDALTQARVYKVAYSEDEAIATLHQMVEAGKLDPDCVACLVESREHCRAIREHDRGSTPPAVTG